VSFTSLIRQQAQSDSHKHTIMYGLIAQIKPSYALICTTKVAEVHYDAKL